MAERRKLTKEALARLKLPDGKAEHTVWDTELKGFGVRIRKAGSRNFIVKYRVGGIDRQMTIGPASPEGLAAARTAAAKALHDAKAGHDPQAAKAQRHQEARETLGELVEHYLAQAEKRLRPSSLRETRRHLMEQAKPLHGRSARAITTADVARRLDEITEASGPIASNRVRAALSALFGWAMKRGRVTANPVIGTEANKERSRARVLKPEELRAIWTACVQEAEFGRIVRLLVLTGCRRQEVGDMRWSELSADRTTWTIPAIKTKNGVAHTVAMAPFARVILEDQPRRAGRDLVFGEGNSTRTGYSGWTRAKWRLERRITQANAKAAGRDEPTPEDQPAPWTLHDLRRTFATVCAEALGTAPHVIEACLNHVEKRREGVAGIYNRATYAEPMARTWKAYADWIAELVNGEEATGNVVALRR